MFAEEFYSYIGNAVYSEFNETLGIIIGYTCDGFGEIKSVIIRSASEIHEVPIDRFEIKQSTVVMLSNISYEFKMLERKLRNVYIRYSNLAKVDYDEISNDVAQDMKNKVEESYKQVTSSIEKFKSNVEARLNNIYNTIKSIDSAILELKMTYINGNLSQEKYQESLNRLKDAKDRLKNEISFYSKYISAVDSLVKGNIVEVLVQ